MCDDDIHQGRLGDGFTRRDFGAAAGAALAVGGVAALAEVAVAERDVRVKTPDGEADAVLFHPQGAGKWPAVLIWPDVVSLRPSFRRMGRRLAGAGFVVLVPNLYYRVKAAPVVEPGFSFANPADREKLTPLRVSVTPTGAVRDSVAYLAFLDAQPPTDRAKKAGVQGYCMGGPLAFRTAGAVPGRVGAVASFHGGGLVTEDPESPHLTLPKSRAEYLVLVADNDDQKEPAAKEKVKAALAAAGRPHKVEVYQGAAHGWTVPDSQVYDEAAAERAWADLLALYRRALV